MGSVRRRGEDVGTVAAGTTVQRFAWWDSGSRRCEDARVTSSGNGSGVGIGCAFGDRSAALQAGDGDVDRGW